MRSIILAKVKKKSRKKKAAKKTVISRRKKVVKKKTTKSLIKSLTSRFKASRFKIDKNNWIVFYYAGAYIGIFGLFALAIYFSN